MKALSIKQPWAWAILNAGKDWENRTWATKYRGQLLIHAGKTFDTEGYHFMEGLGIELPSPWEMFRGGIVGKVVLFDCIKSEAVSNPDKNRWLFGPWAWRLANPIVLPFRELKGQLGLFEVPEATQ